MPFDPDVHVGTAAVVTRRRQGDPYAEYLCVRRGRYATHGAGTLGFPGGWIDFGQTPEEAAVRELFEELNVTVESSDMKYVRAADTVANTYPELGMHVVCVFVNILVCDSTDIANMEPNKHDGYEWHTLRNLNRRDDLFPPLRSWVDRNMGVVGD